MVGKIVLAHFLSGLIAVEGKTSTGTFHYNAWAQTAQNTRLVILRWVQRSNDSVIRVRELSIARRACPAVDIGVEASKGPCALEAEYMTANWGQYLLYIASNVGQTCLQVVTKACSYSLLRHFSSLQRNAKSI